MLNWGIIKHPINWVTVGLMVFIGLMAFNLLLTPYHPTDKGATGNA